MGSTSPALQCTDIARELIEIDVVTNDDVPIGITDQCRYKTSRALPPYTQERCALHAPVLMRALPPACPATVQTLGGSSEAPASVRVCSPRRQIYDVSSADWGRGGA